MRYLLFPFSLFYFVGCQTYQPYRPASLPSADSAINTATRLAATRQASATGELSLAEAARLLGTYNPDLIALEAELETAGRLAGIPTPLPNPELEVGSAFGVRLPEDGRRVGPRVGWAFSLPLGPRRMRADDLNAARAAAAELALKARHRELYLALRTAYTEVALARRQLGERELLVASAATSAVLARKLAELGTLTRLDVGLMELEYEELRLAFADAEAAVADAENDLAKLIGVGPQMVSGRSLQDLRLEGEWPEPSALHQLLAGHHPELGRLRGEFVVTDAALRLELARQVPDLTIASELEQEVGENKQVFGLGIGVELPLFDRNAQEIAAASGERDAVQSRYEATLAAAIAELDGQLQRFARLSRRRRMLQTDLLPLAESSLKDAERMLEIGEVEALRLLELQRRERGLRLNLLETEGDRMRALLAVESTIGRPLFLLQGENLPEIK